MKRPALVLLGIVFAVVSLAHAAELPLPYGEGSVWRVQTLHVKAGLWEEYVRTLDKTKKLLDEAKKQKLLVSYKIIQFDAATPSDWNLMLMLEYKDMAALDGLNEKMRALAGTMIGDETARKDLAVKRLDLREIVGEKTGRELIFK